MKILQIIQRPQLRGAEIFACQLSAELVKAGAEVDVAYLFWGGDELIQQFSQLNFIDLHGDQSRRWWDFSTYARLNKLIKAKNYNVIQANAGDTLKYAVLSKKIHRWKNPLIFRNANKMSAFISNTLHLQLIRWLLKSCAYFISVSENSRRDLIRLYAGAEKISTTIPIGTYLFNSTQPLQQKDSSQPVFISIGSFVPEKNHMFLLDIFHAYYQRYQKGILWLVGDGKLRPMLENRARALKIDSHIKFWGYQKEVIPILKSADVMILPSLIEGMPGVILEAMSCGVPVIASKVGGIPEVVKDGFTGFCIENYDAAEYADRIFKLLAEAGLKENMVKNAHTLVANSFLMDKIAGRFFDVYSVLIGK
jgi:L-malate glycosyltransferase